MASGSGGLNGPDAGATFGPDGNFYIPSYWTGRILSYDGATGDFIGVFAQGIPRPRDLVFRPDGYLYVTSESGNRVDRFDAAGALVDTFIAAGSGGLDGATGLEFDDDGFVYVGSAQNNQVLKYDATDGSFVGIHIDGGPLGMNYPTFLTIVDEASPISGMGLGQPNANRVRVHDATGQPTAVDFLAYGASAWGVHVAGSRLFGSTPDQILTGPGPGDVFGPQVRGRSSEMAPRWGR